MSSLRLYPKLNVKCYLYNFRLKNKKMDSVSNPSNYSQDEVPYNNDFEDHVENRLDRSMYLLLMRKKYFHIQKLHNLD